MDSPRPDFLVVGAMKCATTTLHEQLARQRGLFMTRPKEPNYFSDDAAFARGPRWYASLFEPATPGQIRGESSTHYTKLPTYPRTIGRISRAVPGVKIIYVMRHPVERLVSHYVHERSLDSVPDSLERAIDAAPGLVEYGLYSRQIGPYLDAFGPANILPVFFGRLVLRPQESLERIGRFLRLGTVPQWDTSLRPQNVGRERLRKSVVREALVRAPALTAIRRRMAPRLWAGPIKALWRMKGVRADLTPALHDRLRDRFDPDLRRLGAWLGVDLDCANFAATTEERTLEWAQATGPGVP